MATWKCDLCSHIYDEAKESTKWNDLPADWVCPICGSPRDSFVVAGKTQPVVVSTEAEQPMPTATQCNLCSHIYDESKESVH